MRDFDGLIDEIERLPDEWMGAAAVQLRAILRHAQRLGAIHHSAETGSGKTTVLFSHLSSHHLSFAKDDAKSISAVRSSPLFNSDTVTYIEGPTQMTLPKYTFTQAFQIVLIDGPHAYPFPDMEYYYFYPHISAGGLLIIDDIQIPTIGRMCEILKADPMWELLEEFTGMAFLRRTRAPMVDPRYDGWWQQGYNLPYYQEVLASQKTQSSASESTTTVGVRGVLGRMLPPRLKSVLRRALKGTPSKGKA
jgi:hypothetical protein